MAQAKNSKKKSKAGTADIVAAIATADPPTADEAAMIEALGKPGADPTLRLILDLIEAMAAGKGTAASARTVLSRIDDAGDAHAKTLQRWLDAGVATPQAVNTLTKALVTEVERQIPHLPVFVGGDWAQAKIALTKDAGDDALPAAVRARAKQLVANLRPERVTMLTGAACATLYAVVVIVAAVLQP